MLNLRLQRGAFEITGSRGSSPVACHSSLPLPLKNPQKSGISTGWRRESRKNRKEERLTEEGRLYKIGVCL